MNKIENIIFDFGGVLYDISFERGAKAFENLGFNPSEFPQEFLSVFRQFENGILQPNEFINQLQLLSDHHITENEIVQAFNQILIGIDAYKVADLRNLKQKFNLFLLSNTNEIHFKIYSEEIKENIRTSDFYNLFVNEYYSYLLKMRKPDASIFNFVIKDSNLDPNGTLFVDDSYENINAAASLGLQPFWIENADSWKKLIELLKVNIER